MGGPFCRNPHLLRRKFTRKVSWCQRKSSCRAAGTARLLSYPDLSGAKNPWQPPHRESGPPRQSAAALNPARQVALISGVPAGVPAFTVNKVCALGMKSVALAALSVASGERNIVIAGGIENMGAAK